MTLKEIKSWPFEEFTEKCTARWQIIVREPVVDGERLLVVDALKNTECNAYIRRECESFRVICAKKGGWVKGVNQNGRESKKVLDNAYVLRHDYLFISEKDEARLERFFAVKESENHNLVALCNWINKITAETDIKRRLERGELMDGDYQFCPDSLPEGLVDFVRTEIIPQDNTLIYKKGNVQGKCFKCGEDVRAFWPQRFRQNETTYCPNCGEKVVCAMYGGNAYRAEALGNVAVVQKGTDGEIVFFRQFRIVRDQSARWTNIAGFLKETVRYAIKGNKTAKWQIEGKYNYFSHTERYDLEEWTRWQGMKIYDGGFYFCPTGAKEAIAGTMMQYADLDGYLNSNIRYKNSMEFLMSHAKYPVVEFLWKAGYWKVLQDKICGASRETREAIRWKRTELKECFKFPMRYLKIMEPGEWTLAGIEAVNRLWKIRGEKTTAEDIETMVKLSVSEMDYITDALAYAKPGKILRYAEKQLESRKVKGGAERYLHLSSILHEYQDYILECQQLRLDLKDKAVLFPKNLRSAHERTMDQVEFESNKKEALMFEKVAAGLEKYTWRKGNLLIRPAKEWPELKKEGRALNHCVGSYAKRMAEGKTYIFMIRKADAPDESYFTLELCKGKVIQCRTKNNRSYDTEKEVKAFVDEWVEKVVKKGGVKKKRKNKEAAA